jgi:hypothetical protein
MILVVSPICHLFAFEELFDSEMIQHHCLRVFLNVDQRSGAVEYTVILKDSLRTVIWLRWSNAGCGAQKMEFQRIRAVQKPREDSVHLFGSSAAGTEGSLKHFEKIRR